MLPAGASFSVSWFINGNLVLLLKKFFPVRWTERRKKLGMHIHNAPTHNSRMIQDLSGNHLLRRLPHPSYSPDISPSNFCLFGKGKRALIGQAIPDETDLLEAATEIWNGISYAELHCIFRS
jgi:hypothetical protein